MYKPSYYSNTTKDDMPHLYVKYGGILIWFI